MLTIDPLQPSADIGYSYSSKSIWIAGGGRDNTDEYDRCRSNPAGATMATHALLRDLGSLFPSYNAFFDSKRARA